jgi:ribonucleotide monophosphatase NagD (HAD superfamily)
MGLKPAECAMVGDILEMDILAGARAGLETIYVLSGVGREEDLRRSTVVPTHVARSIADLV